MTTITGAKVAWGTKVFSNNYSFLFIYSEQLNERNGHLAICVHAYDCTKRIKWCYKLLSAKQVSNEDLDNQLGAQTLTALFTPLGPIDHGFHAGSA